MADEFICDPSCVADQYYWQLLNDLAKSLGLSIGLVSGGAAGYIISLGGGTLLLSIGGGAVVGMAVGAGAYWGLSNAMGLFAEPTTSAPIPLNTAPSIRISNQSTSSNIVGWVDGFPARLSFRPGPLGTLLRKVFIKSASADLYWNHQVTTRYFGLADQRWDPATGAYDGTVWDLWDTPLEPNTTLIKSYAATLFVNHEVGTKAFGLNANVFDPGTRANDGTLWQIIDTGGGTSIIKSPFAPLYVNHQVSTRYFGLADQPWDPATGAYDGTLWQIISV